jgi:hypothetical protein
MVEKMVFETGGHTSHYYAGILVVFSVGWGFATFFSKLVTTLFAVTLFSIYLIPLLLFDQITYSRELAGNCIFMVTILAAGVVWRCQTDNLLRQHIKMEYDMEVDKKKLKESTEQLGLLLEEKAKEVVETDQKFRFLFDAANDGVIITDAAGVIQDANYRACEMYGFKCQELIGTSIIFLEAGALAGFSSVRQRILKGEAQIYESKPHRKDGSDAVLEVSAKAVAMGNSIYVQLLLRDVTERLRLQAQVTQSQKIESMGIMAGGLVHDFNNILSTIMSYVDLAFNSGAQPAEMREQATAVKALAESASGLLKQVLSFGKKEVFQKVPLNINTLVTETCKVMQRVLAEKGLVLDCGSYTGSSCFVLGSKNELEQALMNLIINAVDATKAGGRIAVSTRSVSLGDDASKVHPLLTAGDYLVLSVSDTGSGMSEAVKQKLFDPFFTTKGEGKGTGLGLTMVFDIIQRHGGVITLVTTEGKGTTFDIYLTPVHGDTVKEDLSVPPYRGRVLVVDDDTELANIIRKALEGVGYQVFATTNPFYAMDMFDRIAEELDVMVTDIIMPLVTGEDLIKRIKGKNPKIKVVAVSGRTDLDALTVKHDIDAFVKKPFTSSDIIAAVTSVLEIGAEKRAESSALQSIKKPTFE